MPDNKLPAACYSILPSTGELIMIERGVCGYYPSNKSMPFPDINRKIADEFNTHCGVTRAQEEAMLAGSLFGWDKPAAKPRNYDADGKPLRQQPRTKPPKDYAR